MERALTPKPPAAKLVDALRAHTGKSIVVAEFGFSKRAKECVCHFSKQPHGLTIPRDIDIRHWIHLIIANSTTG